MIEGSDGAVVRNVSEAVADKQAGTPLAVEDGQTVVIADVGEVVNNGGTDKHVPKLADNGTAGRDDKLGKMIVEGDAVVVHVERRLGIDGEGGQGRDVEQPVAAGHPVVAISGPDADVGHLEHHFIVARGLVPLALPRKAQQETAGRTALDVALREGGRIGEPAMVEGVVGIDVQRLHRQHLGGQVDARFGVRLVPAREVVGILINDFEAPSVAVGAEIHLEVVVLAQHLGRVQGEVERDAPIVDADRERRFVVGSRVRAKRITVVLSLNLHSRPRHIEAPRQGPMGLGTRDIHRVDVGAAVANGQQAVGVLQHARHLLRPDAGRSREEQKHDCCKGMDVNETGCIHF